MPFAPTALAFVAYNNLPAAAYEALNETAMRIDIGRSRTIIGADAPCRVSTPFVQAFVDTMMATTWAQRDFIAISSEFARPPKKDLAFGLTRSLPLARCGRASRRLTNITLELISEAPEQSLHGEERRSRRVTSSG